MTTLKAFLKKITENVSLKLLSLGFAVLLWIVVVSIDNPVMTLPFSPITVDVVNADIMESEGKAFELSDSSRSIGISVKAERSVLSELSRDDFVAVVDMENIEGNRVPIEVKATRYADKIQSITPRQKYATVLVENLKSQQFKIQVVTTGEAPEGYAVGSSSLTTNVVRISGPESIVSTIDRAEVHVNVSNMTSEIHSIEKIILYDKNGSTVDASTLTFSITETEVTVDMWKTKEIAVRAGYTGNPAAGYAVSGTMKQSFSSVLVKGTDSALSEVSSISIPSNLLNIEGATGKVSKAINITGYLPAGLYLADSEENYELVLTVNIEALQAKEIEVPASNISIVNVPEGLSASLSESVTAVKVAVTGLATNLAEINAASITGTVDVAALKQQKGVDTLTANVYDANVVFSLPAGVTQGTAPSVSIVIQGAEKAAVSENNADTSENDDNTSDNEAEKKEEESEDDSEKKSDEETQDTDGEKEDSDADSE